MNSRRWRILLLLAFLEPLIALAQPANSTAIVAPEISDSENRNFRLVIEAIPDSTGELQATMLKVNGSFTATHWVARIPYFRASTPSPPTYVSNNGDFFVRASSDDNMTFFRKDPHSPTLRGTSKFGSLIYKLDNLFAGVEELRGFDVLRLRNNEQNRWDAYNTVDASEFRPTPEDITRWNEIARREILEKLYAAQREDLRRKAIDIAPSLGRIAAPIANKRAAPTENDFLLLATIRNPDDRKWIEKLVENGSSLVVRRLQLLRKGGGQPYYFQDTDYSRAQADWMLGFWDKKTSWDERFVWSVINEIDDSTRYTLGKVIGTIRLPMPMPIYQNATQATFLHIRLIRAEDLHKNQPSAIEERIDAPIGFVRGPDRREVYNVRFAFTTVLPGSYHLKAIWDKRRPLSDTNSAGPGDYETTLSPRFNLAAGATITNLLFCTNRIAGGEAYYRADELFAKRWLAGNPAAPEPSPARRYPVEADHEIHR